MSRVTTSSGDDWQLLLNNAGFLGKVQQDTAELFSTKLARAIGSGSNSTAAGDGIVLLKSVDANVCNATLLAPFGLQKEKPMKNRDMLSNSLFHSLTGNNRIANLDFNSLDVIGNGNADNHMFQTEIQLFTMKTFPENVKVKIGGLVVARSVKFLGKLEATLSDQETREGWWQELRDEIRSHAKVLCCKHIIGYSETCSIFNDVCILSAFGTAAVLKGLSYPSAFLTPAGGDDPSSPKRSRTSSEAVGDENTSILDGHEAPRRMRTGSSDSIEERSSRKGSKADIPSKVSLNRSSSYQSIIRNPLPVKRQTTTPQTIDELAIADNAVSNNSVINWPPTANATGYQQNSANSTKKRSITRPCAFTHVPYNHNTAPFSFMRLIPCQSCKRKWVPETILTTTEPPNNVNVKGHAQLLEARVCRSRRAGSGENDAVKISDVLPFAEFDLQRQIILKLKILGMNAAFGYSCRLQVGNDMVIATASCTAVFLKSLPAPPSLQIGRVREGRTEQDLRLARLQKEIDDLSQYNKMLLEKSSKSVRSSSRQRDNTYGSPTSRSRIMQNGDGQKGGRLSDGIAKTDYFISEALPHGFTNSSNSYRFGSIGEDEEKSLTLSSSTESSLSSSESSENEDSSLESPSSSSSSEESEEDSDEEEYLAHEKDSNDVHKLEKELDNANLTASASRDTEGKNKDILVVPKRNRHRSNSYEDLETARQGQASGKTPGKATKKKEKRMVYKDERPPFMLEVDDETDADIMAVLSDWWLPSKLDIVNVGVRVLFRSSTNFYYLKLTNHRCLVCARS